MFEDVASCAEELAPLPPDIGEARVGKQLEATVSAEVGSAAGYQHFVVGPARVEKLRVVPLDGWPKTVFVAFSLAYVMDPIDGEVGRGRSDGKLVAAGSCYYDYGRGRVIMWSLDEIRISWREADGTPRTGTVKYGTADMSAEARLQVDGDRDEGQAR